MIEMVSKTAFSSASPWTRGLSRSEGKKSPGPRADVPEALFALKRIAV